MAELLSPDDIAAIQESVAPTLDDENGSIGEIWRTPGAPVSAPVTGGSGVNARGFPVAGNGTPSQPASQRAKVAEYPVEFFHNTGGKDDDASGGSETVLPWTLLFNWADDPDIGPGDKVLIRRPDWEASTAYEVGEYAQPTVSTGRGYRVKVAGTTGSVEPTWPSTPRGAMVVDGTVTWEFAGPLRAFEVIDPGGHETYDVLRVVKAQEVLNWRGNG